MGREARARAAQRAQAAPSRLIFGLTRAQKLASLKLSYALAVVEAMKREESAGIAGESGAGFVKLQNLEDHILSVLDYYRVEKFHRADLERAETLFEAMDQKVEEVFPRMRRGCE